MFELYQKMWHTYQNGEISEKLWLAFVDECLEKALKDGEETLIRLKNI